MCFSAFHDNVLLFEEAIQRLRSWKCRPQTDVPSPGRMSQAVWVPAANADQLLGRLSERMQRESVEGPMLEARQSCWGRRLEGVRPWIRGP